jgi:hypothetical protein
MVAAVAAASVAIASARVDGATILGRSQAQVVSVLGSPVGRETYPVRRDLRFAGIEVIFADGVHASAYVVPEAASPADLRRRIARAGLREERRYRCDARGCFGTFFTRGDTRRVIYGLEHGKAYLGEQVWPQPEP